MNACPKAQGEKTGINKVMAERAAQSKLGDGGLNAKSRGRLRKSELAGWRTRSLLPDNRREFLPILKLRGLPYFCSKENIMEWFGSFANNVVHLILVAEIGGETNSGFGLVTMDSASSAMLAWDSLHKKCIDGKRFVEVFCLLPPYCPLTKRGSQDGQSDASTTASGTGSGSLCSFCACPLEQHQDRGVASLSAASLKYNKHCPPGLMNIAYLNVPALVYQEVSAAFDIELFNPETWQSSPLYQRPARLASLIGPDCVFDVGGCKYIDLMSIDDYDLRLLLLEIYYALGTTANKPATLSYIANNLSLRARAYLFITENKLQNLLEQYCQFFSLCSTPTGLLVAIQPNTTDRSITNLASSGVAKRGKKGRRRARKSGSKLIADNFNTEGRSEMGPAMRHMYGGNDLRKNNSSNFRLIGEGDSCERAWNTTTSVTDKSILENEAELGGLLTEIIRGTSCRQHNNPSSLLHMYNCFDELTLERSITCPVDEKWTQKGAQLIDAIFSAEPEP